MWLEKTNTVHVGAVPLWGAATRGLAGNPAGFSTKDRAGSAGAATFWRVNEMASQIRSILDVVDSHPFI